MRLTLGENDCSGKNWWCVLYPGLCRAACGSYALPQENDLICGEYIVRFRLVDFVQSHCAPQQDQILLRP
nr:stage II sporulation protein R [Faecalibacterium sp. OF04-11AC]